MNILHTIEVDVEKFFVSGLTRLSRWANSFVRIFGKAPSAIQTVENFVQMVAPFIEAAVSLVDPLVDPAVAAALSMLEVSLAAVQTAAADANSGQSLLQNLKNFAADVPKLLGALQIKNPALKATVQKFVSMAVNEAAVLIPAVEAWVKEIEARNVPATDAVPTPAGS